jgi:hypothetical protein
MLLLMLEAWLLTKIWPESWRPKPTRRRAKAPTKAGAAAVPKLAAPPQSDAP